MMSAAGTLQLCVGIESGVEANVHSMREIFAEDDTEGVIQVDANNAFNTFNRSVLLHNIWILCPEIATYTTNCYAKPARLFVTGGVEIQSEEGTTQGDPIAMPIYAVSILPLLTSIIVDDKASRITNLKQAAFADDLVGAGSLASLKFWWDAILRYGPYIGYEAKASKSWLIIKEEYENCARDLFYGSDLNITVKGKKHLGAIIGSEDLKKRYFEELINDWCKELNILSEIALIEPHAAYTR